MTDVRNTDGKLVCRLDEKSYFVEIIKKGCLTKIQFKPDDMPEIVHVKLENINIKLRQ